ARRRGVGQLLAQASRLHPRHLGAGCSLQTRLEIARGHAASGQAVVSRSPIRLKNWSAIIFETPPSIRWPTPAMSPPTWTSALYATRVPPSMSDRVIRVSERTNPGPPLPSAARRYDSVGFLSWSLTLPSKVPLTAATPILSVALYSSGATSSSFSQPGIAFWSTAGSRNASQTFWRGALTSYEPSNFLGCSPFYTL